MKLSDVNLQDGKACAHLINLLKTGRWEMSGSEAEVHGAVLRWVQALAMGIAAQIKQPESAKTPDTPAAPVAPQKRKKK